MLVYALHLLASTGSSSGPMALKAASRTLVKVCCSHFAWLAPHMTCEAADLLVTPKVTFDPKSDSEVAFFGSKSCFWGYFGGDPEKVTFWSLLSYFLVFRGFRGSRRSAASQHMTSLFFVP